MAQLALAEKGELCKIVVVDRYVTRRKCGFVHSAFARVLAAGRLMRERGLSALWRQDALENVQQLLCLEGFG